MMQGRGVWEPGSRDEGGKDSREGDVTLISEPKKWLSFWIVSRGGLVMVDPLFSRCYLLTSPTESPGGARI